MYICIRNRITKTRRLTWDCIYQSSSNWVLRFTVSLFKVYLVTVLMVLWPQPTNQGPPLFRHSQIGQNWSRLDQSYLISFPTPSTVSDLTYSVLTLYRLGTDLMNFDVPTLIPFRSLRVSYVSNSSVSESGPGHFDRLFNVQIRKTVKYLLLNPLSLHPDSVLTENPSWASSLSRRILCKSDSRPRFVFPLVSRPLRATVLSTRSDRRNQCFWRDRLLPLSPIVRFTCRRSPLYIGHPKLLRIRRGPQTSFGSKTYLSTRLFHWGRCNSEPWGIWYDLCPYIP